jgi:predicted component of type VI protein secretion system
VIRFLRTRRPIDETTGEQSSRLRLRANSAWSLRRLRGAQLDQAGELERTTTGQLSLRETYVPPALHIPASPWLTNLVRQLIEFLIAKSRTLGERRHRASAALFLG